MSRQAAIGRAVSAVQNAFIEQGITPRDAAQFAQVLLTRPGVQIGRGGKLFYKGAQYAPDAFAKSTLGQIISGQTAEKRNEAAIKGDPGYLQAIAQLGLARDQSTAGLSDQERQALLQFGDPSFITDPTLRAEAQANPFSDTRLLNAAYQNQQMATRNAANRGGVYQGGGLTSGLNEDQRAYAAQNQDAVMKLQQLLSSINTQRAQAQQAYGVGQTQAFQDAYNALLASGAISAAHAPNYGIGQYRVRGYGGGGGGGSGGNAPSGGRPSLPPGMPYPTGYPGGGPIQYNPAPNGTRPPQLVPPTGYPNPLYDQQAFNRKYGINA